MDFNKLEELKSKHFKLKAFTLAEMMIVLLILSLILAAFLPVITKRSKVASSGAGAWRYTTDNNSDIYYASADSTQGAAIGSAGLAGENARLLLNTRDNTQSAIVFQNTSTTTGRLLVDGSHNIGLGNITLASNALSGTNSISIGNASNSTNASSIAIGSSAQATGDHSIAIGGWDGTTKANASGPFTIALGYCANAVNTIDPAGAYIGTVAIGSVSTADGGSVALGDTAKANHLRSVAIGPNSSTGADYSIAIGYATGAAGAGAIAIGTDDTGAGATASVTDQFTLGTLNHKVYIPGTLTVDKAVTFKNTVTVTTLSATALNITAGSIVYASDRRLKNVGGEFNEGLDKIKQLQSYNYTYKKDKKKLPHVGIMAQDLQKVFPNAVSKGDKGYLMIRQDDMFYAIINSIKQLDKMVQGIVADVKALATRVQQVENKIVALIKTEQITNKKIKDLEIQNKKLQAQNKAFEIRLKRLEARAK